MKRICNFPIYQYLILGLVYTLLNSCDKEVDPKLLPALSTNEVVRMTEATAYCGGNITSDAGSVVTSRGVCWSETPNPTIEDKKTIDAAGTGEFESRIVGLNPSTTYFIRAYATNKKDVGYGLQVTFKTKSLSIITTPIKAATINTAVCGGTIVTDGDSLNVTERGICWNTSANPTILNSKIANGKGKGNYTSSMADLQIATQYYVRAYATNLTGTFYGDEIIFNTTNGSMTLTTKAATSITAISATVEGNVPNDGGATVTERGFCLSKLPNPTISNKIVNGSGVGSFASNINSLEANTTYYVRVFATNSVGTVYGNEISFTTKDGVIALSTTAASAITATSANIGGTITSDGGASITARGICWSTTPNPTTANGKSTNSGGIGSFSTNITGLNNDAIYYAKSFATNSFGTVYGNEISFITKSGLIILSTTAVSAISTITATSGGNVISDGGSAITARGVCWSTSPSPTIANTKTWNGTGTGIFASSLTGLLGATTYYLRAYSTNEVGTAYGAEVSFTTNYAIGVSYLGGKIAYLDASGIHGFVCALADQRFNAKWYNGSYISTGATNMILETSGVYGITKSGGRKNTDAIILALGAGPYAASSCARLTTGGATVGDWYLPSKGELNKIFANLAILGDFTASIYWSSSETGNGDAWYQNFSDGSVGYARSIVLNVCPIRAF